jgi:hypothetical protein
MTQRYLKFQYNKNGPLKNKDPFKYTTVFI